MGADFVRGVLGDGRLDGTCPDRCRARFPRFATIRAGNDLSSDLVAPRDAPRHALETSITDILLMMATTLPPESDRGPRRSGSSPAHR